MTSRSGSQPLPLRVRRADLPYDGHPCPSKSGDFIRSSTDKNVRRMVWLLPSRILWTFFCLITLIAAAGCPAGTDEPLANEPEAEAIGTSGEQAPAEESSSTAAPAEAASTEKPVPADEPPQEMTPREAIALQLELLKKQDVDALKQHFTERLRERITADAVVAAKDQAGGMTVAELIATIETEEVDGMQTARVYMPGGRMLTDTIWFQ